LVLDNLKNIINIDEYINTIFTNNSNIFINKTINNFNNYLKMNNVLENDKYILINNEIIMLKIKTIQIDNKEKIKQHLNILSTETDVYGWIILTNIKINKKEKLDEILDFIEYISIIVQYCEINLINYFMYNKMELTNAIQKKENELFLANMGHELRTPLNCIKGLIEILNFQEKNFDNKTKEYLVTMDTCTDYLVNITNKIVDIAKIKSKIYKLQYDKFNLLTLCKDIRNIYENKFNKITNIKFEINCDCDIPLLIIDKDSLLQIIINLLDNSIKFTKNGKIELNIKKNNKINKQNLIGIILEVKDTGIGISENNFETIFSPYKQLNYNNEKKTNSPGLGLGLAIVKGIVELMEGEININSQLNIGTSFTINFEFKTADRLNLININDNNNNNDKNNELINILIFSENYYTFLNTLNNPLITFNICNNIKRIIIELQNENEYDYILISYLNLLKISEIYDLQKINKKKLFIIMDDNNLKNTNILYENNFNSFKYDEFESFLLKRFNIAHKTCKNIMLVDDDVNNLLVLKEMINLCINNNNNNNNNIKWNIAELNSGEACLEFLKNNTCDILFLDLMMPYIDGFDVLSYIQNQNNNIANKPYIIIVTASCSTNDKEKSYDLGCDNYLKKPFSLKTISNIFSLLNN